MATDRKECRAAFEVWLQDRGVVFESTINEWFVPDYEPAGVACMWYAWQAAWSHHDPLPSVFSEGLYEPTKKAKPLKRGFFS